MFQKYLENESYYISNEQDDTGESNENSSQGIHEKNKSSNKSNNICQLIPKFVYENDIIIEIKNDDYTLGDYNINNKDILSTNLKKKNDEIKSLSLQSKNEKSIKNGVNIIKKINELQKDANVLEKQIKNLNQKNKTKQKKKI